jgi:hypothetical protein
MPGDGGRWDALGGPDPGTTDLLRAVTSPSGGDDMVPDMSGDESQPAARNWWQRAVRSGYGQAARWLAVLGLVLWRWAAGAPTTFTGWLPVLIVAVVLLLPDAESVDFGGIRLEMRRTREEIVGLRQQVTQLQITQAGAVGAVIGTDAIKELGATLLSKFVHDEATGRVPYTPTAPAASEPTTPGEGEPTTPAAPSEP